MHRVRWTESTRTDVGDELTVPGHLDTGRSGHRSWTVPAVLLPYGRYGNRGLLKFESRVSSIKNGRIQCFLLIQLKLDTRVLILETRYSTDHNAHGNLVSSLTRPLLNSALVTTLWGGHGGIKMASYSFLPITKPRHLLWPAETRTVCDSRRSCSIKTRIDISWLSAEVVLFRSNIYIMRWSELTLWGFDAHCCHIGAAIKHPVPDQIKPSVVIFDIWALWRSAANVRMPGCKK